MKLGFITFLTYAAVACQGAAEALLQAEGGDPAPIGQTGATGTAITDAPKPRGRPRGSTNAAPAAGAPAGTGPTDGERFDANRALIKPLIDANKGEEVKKVITKYSPTGLKDMPAASQADFEKDIETLGY